MQVLRQEKIYLTILRFLLHSRNECCRFAQEVRTAMVLVRKKEKTMSTRAVFTFKDDDGEYSVYRHGDGYPEGNFGGIAAIYNSLESAWDLPRFESDEFAASFVAANKTGSGNVRLTKSASSHGDLEYIYTITCVNGSLYVQIEGGVEFGGSLEDAMKQFSVNLKKS